MIAAPSRDRVTGLMAQVVDLARAVGVEVARGRLQSALLRAEQCERAATAAREEIEDLLRIRSA